MGNFDTTVYLWIRRLNDPRPVSPGLIPDKAGLVRRLNTRYSFSLEHLKVL